MTEAAKIFCIDAIALNSILSTRKIVNLLSESELKIIGCKSTIARTLNNFGSRYKKNKAWSLELWSITKKGMYRLAHKTCKFYLYLLCFLHLRMHFLLGQPFRK